MNREEAGRLVDEFAAAVSTMTVEEDLQDDQEKRTKYLEVLSDMGSMDSAEELRLKHRQTPRYPRASFSRQSDPPDRALYTIHVDRDQERALVARLRGFLRNEAELPATVTPEMVMTMEPKELLLLVLKNDRATRHVLGILEHDPDGLVSVTALQNELPDDRGEVIGAVHRLFRCGIINEVTTNRGEWLVELASPQGDKEGE